MYNEKKHSKLELFKNNNFESELLNLFEENCYKGFIINDDNNNYKNFLFYGILRTIYCTNLGIKCYNERDNYCLYYFFGQDNFDNFIKQKFNEIKPYFTNLIYDKLLEINDLALTNMNNIVEDVKINKNKYTDYQYAELILYKTKIEEIYQSNLEYILEMRNGD